MKKETVKLKPSAMRFVEECCFAKSSPGEGDKKPALEMLAYSGGVIKNHWWWGDLAIDVSGMSIPNKKTPILEDHRTDKKIGFATKWDTSNNQLTVSESTFLNTAESLAFQQNSADGFPYEASIYAKPTIIESVSDGETVDVNGYKFKGPGTIWRKCTLKEASVCTFGYDPNTKSAAMSEDGEEEVNLEYINEKEPAVKLTEKEDTTIMITAEKFKEENPTAFAALVASVTADAEKQFAVVKTELEGMLSAAKTEVEKLSADKADTDKRLVVLEKNDLLRTEQALKDSADNIFARKFSAAGIREDLEPKVRKLVNHNAFVKDGALDTEAFSAAVDAELKDWATDAPSVLGFGISGKPVGENTKEKFAEVVDSTVDRMLGHLGQGKKTE